MFGRGSRRWFTVRELSFPILVSSFVYDGFFSYGIEEKYGLQIGDEDLKEKCN